MKKALLIIALLLTGLFCAVSTNYQMIGVNNSDGFVLDNNRIQTNVFADTTKENVKSKQVFASEGIYKRLSTIYYGDETKVKVNNAYPMYINNGEAIKLLNGGESLITDDFRYIDAYSDLILNDGYAFNSTFDRSDFNDYILVHLTNNLYVNTKEMHIDTFVNSYTIPANSIIYMSTERISYYTLKGDSTFVGETISDVDSDTFIRIGNVEISYGQLLLNLGETVEYHQVEQKSQQEKVEEETKQEETIINKKEKEKKESTKERKEREKIDNDDDDDEKIIDEPEEEQGEDEPVDPEPIKDWVPKVSIGNRFKEGVYTLTLSVNVDDPASTIYGGLVFEVYDQNAYIKTSTTSKKFVNNKLVDCENYNSGKEIEVIGSTVYEGITYIQIGENEYLDSRDVKLQVLKRQSFNTSNGEEQEILLVGLRPDSNYLVSGYYRVKDPTTNKYYEPTEDFGDHKVKHTQFDILTPKTFTTRPVSELGSIIFTEFDTSEKYGNQISVDNVGFTSNSDLDAVSTLSRVQYKITKDGDNFAAGVIPSKQLASLIKYNPTTFTYRSKVESNTKYDVEFTCFDMYGNELIVRNNKVTVETCKLVPVSKINVTYNRDETGKEILGEINISASFDNPDGVPYKNLRFEIYDANGEIYKYYDEESGKYLDYIECIPNQEYFLDGFDLGQKYTVSLVCDCDNNDGNGYVHRELTSRDFSTSSLSLLGTLYLNTQDVSKIQCPDERHRRAIFEVSLANATNVQLPAYVDYLVMNISSEKGNVKYEFTEEDRNILFNEKGKITIDTDRLDPPGLLGITKYNISFTASHEYEDKTTFNIPVNSSTKQFTTVRTPVEILMTTPVTAPGYINTSIMINDVDEVIVGDTAILKIYDLETNKLVASFLIEKNAKDYKEIILSSDSSLSTDGVSYDIKQNGTYRFIFQAEEANTEYGSSHDYPLINKNIDIRISSGVKGKIYLSSLNEYAYGDLNEDLPSNYQQIEYIESHGKEYINTGFIPTKNTEFVLSFFYDQSISGSSSSSGYGVIFGTRESSSSYCFISSGYSSFNTGYFGYGKNTRIAGNLKAHGYNELSLKDGVYTSNGVSKNVSMIDYPSNFYPIYIFCLNQKNAPTSEYSYGKLYKFKIWDDNILVRDFIPCYRKTDNVYGLYDLAEDNFYTNAGKGAFTGGGEVIPISSSIKDPNSSYLSNISVNLTYPDGWLGNKSFYVDVHNDSKPNEVDKLTFKYNESKSTGNIYNFDVTSSLNNALVSNNIDLTYDDISKSFKGNFKYIVDKHADKSKQYTFDLYTILLDNVYLNNSVASLVDGTKEPLSDISFKQDLDVLIDFPKSGMDDYSFYIDIFNEEVSTDLVYDTLYFKHDVSKSDSNKLGFDVYMSSDLNNKITTVILNEDDSIESNKYSGTVNGVTFKNIDDAKYKYNFSIYRKIQNDIFYVPLDTTSFSTESIIYTIANIDEFFAVKSNNHKYVVIDDIEFDDPSVHANNGGKWGSSIFNAQIDFQGFSLTYKGYNNLIYQMSETAEIKNMVYKTTANLIKNTTLTIQGNKNSYGGTLVYANYGKLSNVYVEYSEIQPEDIANEGSKVYRGSTYWSDETDYATVSSHRYAYLNCQSALVTNNYGTIENFVVDVKTDVNSAANAGLVCVHNYGTVRNGYVFNSDTQDYKATANIYRNTSYSSNLKSYNEFGFVCGSSRPSGIHVGIIENVYAIGNINNCTYSSEVYSTDKNDKPVYTSIQKDEGLGIVCGYNTSIVRNSFSNGDVTRTNTFKFKSGNTQIVKTVNDVAYGPTIGYTTSAINRNPNNNYISGYSYNNELNLVTSTIALRSKSWVNDVLNAGNYKEFNVDEMISIGCYPQVKLNDIMPTQPMLILPNLPRKDEVDVIFSETYELGQPGNEEIDAIINERRTGNEIGDLIYGKKEGSDFTSNSQIVVAYVTDSTASQIHSLVFSDPSIQNKVLIQTMNGTGISVAYLEVYNPSEALSQYHVTGLYFKDYSGDKTSLTPINRDLDFSYTKLITDVSEWRSVIENPDQNHRLGADLDFSGISMEDIFVNADFSGTLDGMDEKGISHTIKNIEYDSKAFSSIFPQTVEGSNSADVGLFKSISGKVKNLTLENINIEGGENVGILAGSANGSVIEKVFIKDSYAAGTNRIGGIASSINYSDIFECGVTNTKLISVGGQYNAANENWKNGVGGIAAYVLIENNLERVFVNNIYIESFTTQIEYTCAGGLYGYINGSGNRINGCYASGTINTNANAAGGLIGMNYEAFEINYCYSDVDVNSYFYNAGGLVGLAYNNITSETPLLSFGDVHSATIIQNDERENAFNLIGNNYKQYDKTTKILNGMYYDKATLLSNDILSSSGTSFDGSYINSEEITDNLGSYFKREIEFGNSSKLKGILPKIVDLDGNVLDNQPDNYISGFDSEITININDSMDDKVVIDINHSDDIKINNIYTDYTYVNSLIDTNNNDEFFGVKSLTSRKALSYQLDKNSGDNHTKFTMSSISPNCFYDYYNITAIEYSKNGVTNYLRVNHRLNNINQSFKTINSMSEYERYVTPSIAENFKLECDLDFNDRTVNYYDEKYTNLVINRIIGQKGDDSNYLDLKENKEARPYYEISNLNINGLVDTNNEHGYIYSYESNLFKVILSDISNITFRDIRINGRNSVSLIGKNQSLSHNISFIDCDISNTNNQYNGTAMIGVSFGEMSNILIESCDIKSKSYYTGLLSGFVYSNYYGTDIENININNSSITGIGECGSLIAAIGEDYPFYKRTANIENITLNNSEISTTGQYCGGIIGRTYNSGFISLENCNVNNSKVSSTNIYVGGVLGYNASNGNSKLNNCYVYNSAVESTNTGNCYVGGIVGYQSGNIHNTTVEDCLIVGSGSRIGGITGYNSYSVTRTGESLNRQSYSNDDDQDLFGYVYNTRIYGKSYVGGIAGYSAANIQRGIVDTCEIKGNSYVGGITSANHSYCISQCVVTNSTIIPWRDSKEATYGPVYNATQEYFGGIIGITGRTVSNIIENSFVGGENANYVGGLQGLGRISTKDNISCDSSVENTIVVGKNYVGGLFGGISTNDASYKYANFVNLYSNAYVYGNDYVGGIAGYARGLENKDIETGEIVSYSPMPIIENIYFTGSITSNNSAGAIFGYILGNTELENNCLRNVSSFPSFIKANKISPIICDREDSEFYYNWDNLINDTSDIGVSLYSNTILYLSDADGKVSKQTTIENFLRNTKDYTDYLASNVDVENGYIKFVDTPENVKDSFNKSVAGDSFIALYTSNNDIKNKFYDYGLLDTLTSESFIIDTYRYVKPKDMSYIDYMPMLYSNFKTENTLNFYDENDGGDLIGNRYHTIRNPFVGSDSAYKSVYIQQGIGIPGSEKDIADNSYMANIYDLYASGGIYSTGIGYINKSIEIDDDVFEPIYKNLPSNYQQIEYIESHGKEYINTGFIPTKNTEFVLSFFYDQSISGSSSSSGYGVIFGTRESSSSYCFISSGYSSFNTGYFGYGKNTRIAGNLKAHGYNELSLKDGVYTSNGVSKNVSMIDYPSNFYPIYIFCLNQKNAPTSEYSYGKLYKFKIWDDNILVRDFIPCYRKTDNVYGLYDLAEDNFYTNAGKGAFTGGDIVTEEFDFSRAIYLYPTSSSTLNLEMDDSFANLLDELEVNADLYINGNKLKSLSSTDKCISLNYNYKIGNSMEVVVEKDDYRLKLPLADITSAVTNIISSCKEHIYYISDGNLYNENELIDDSKIYVHLYHDEVVDSDGNIYSLPSLEMIGNTSDISLLSNPISLYSLQFNGKNVETYGSYSVIDGKISDTYRIFKARGNLIALDSNTDPVADPLYARYENGKSTILMLSKDGKVYSIGTNSVLDKLKSFTNDNIVAISTNLHDSALSSNTYIGFAYGDGSVAIYDLLTGNRVTNTSKLSSTGGTNGNALKSFLSNALSFNNMFSFSGSPQELSGEKNKSEQISGLLSSTGISLNDVVDYAAEDGNNMISIVNAVKNNKPNSLSISLNTNNTFDDNSINEKDETDEDNSIVIDTPIINNSHYEDNDGPVSSIQINGGSNISISIADANGEEFISNENNISEENEENSEFPTPEDPILSEEIMENNEENFISSNGLVTDNTESSNKDFITVFNGETNEFDILDVDELLENPEEIKSENMKVVDRSTLKALYNALGESKDNTTKRGIIIYTIIALIIVILLIPVIIIKKRLSK